MSGRQSSSVALAGEYRFRSPRSGTGDAFASPAIPDEGVSASLRARNMDEGHVPLVDIVGESMRVGKYQDQMMCARNSKRSGDFPRNSNLRTCFVVAKAILQDIQNSQLR